MKKYPVWAVGTTLFIIAFIITLAIFGIRTARVPFDLVASDYYEQTLTYQERIDAKARAQELTDKPEVKIEGSQALLIFPESLAPRITSGEFTLFRPSNADHDVRIAIPSGRKQVSIELGDKPKGNWKTKVLWEMDGKTYYQEGSLYLQ